MIDHVRATSVRFAGDLLHVLLSDGCDVALDLRRVNWLCWLLKATPAKRAAWSIEPRGFAIHWDELDDGIEVCHVLGTQPIA